MSRPSRRYSLGESWPERKMQCCGSKKEKREGGLGKAAEKQRDHNTREWESPQSFFCSGTVQQAVATKNNSR